MDLPRLFCARFGWPNGMQIVTEKRETQNMVTPTKTSPTTQGNSTPISDKELAELLWKGLWEKAGQDGGLIKANIVEVFEKTLKDKRPVAMEQTFDVVDWDNLGWTYYSPILDNQHKIDGPEDK